MSKKKEKKQKKERSKKDWKVRAEFLKDLQAWWKQIYPNAKGPIKGYITRLQKKINQAEENSK